MEMQSRFTKKRSVELIESLLEIIKGHQTSEETLEIDHGAGRGMHSQHLLQRIQRLDGSKVGRVATLSDLGSRARIVGPGIWPLYCQTGVSTVKKGNLKVPVEAVSSMSCEADRS